ncbi:prepilin peptidase [Sulfitobacter mediterraneus]|uniref:prepilin peptidase n=1 Tax=Sulfitobacter mediterraneus TaxID=83219 RepID=UPI001FD4D35E|nr:A24 family peptidase [Sulfitobacter mediterraneus]
MTLPLIVAGLGFSAAAGQTDLTASLVGGAVGFGLFAAIGQVYFKRNGREGLGLGDAKLFAAAGTWLGWNALPATLLIASGGALAFALIARRTAGHIAFGPWIALGFFVLWLTRHSLSGE